MSASALFLHADAAAFFHGLRREEKEPLPKFRDLLEQYPTTEGEATERDSVGRTVHVKFVRRLKIVYWANQSGEEVKILRIERLRGVQGRESESH
jgi:hypothetical protein